MILRILTDRPEQYTFLENLYREKAELRYYSTDHPPGSDDPGGEDILIVDPQLIEKNPAGGMLLKQRVNSGKQSIICEPDRERGLIRELKAAGLEAAGSQLVNPRRSSSTVSDEYSSDLTHNLIGQPDFRIIIGIVELNKKADAGFFTMLLAEELASESLRDGSLVTVFAPGIGFFYHALDLGRKFSQTEFQQISDLAEMIHGTGQKEKHLLNIDDGISWVVDSENAEERKNLEYRKRLELIEGLEGNYVLDCNTIRCFQEEQRSGHLYTYPDVLLVVSDSLPSSFMNGRIQLNTVRRLDIPLIYVVTHVTDAVRKEWIFDYLDTEEVCFLPEVSTSAVCEAEYAGENPYRVDVIRKETMMPVCNLIERIRSVSGIHGSVPYQ